ncbi:phosphoglycerate mutase-like protein [Hortaea werneckii]|nr:phosphoglycerate mutase-like protein [Hortaea werneckii]KAI7061297.1 phosphoglycerate mutase-like protein [Hortaea werneckii]KAI7203028.1 phosphoglycerate mutase-like protein [Hortaea werneckii]KAI7284838.1 phosphoglycerate mutase-like protein [Hortaea werneckii]
MGKPRLIILIRHAQSEGNRNREIHQMIPDHRVKLTEEGWRQAEEAGRRLRTLLTPDDTLQIYTSPYRRTRETTEGLLSTLTDPNDLRDGSPSPFDKSHVKAVYEEPRIREQDFGNFQPCSAEMERMWAERADYGHFFYRIPNGESAADAYDRISGFNESLWRQFGDESFPSVCVLVTHGLMTRVFLMKWYHWSVEYFEDLRNVGHCEFVVMRRKDEEGVGQGKYMMESNLRTWSELKRQKALEAKEDRNIQDPLRRNTLSAFMKQEQVSPGIPPRKWGGCVGGCDHDHGKYPRRKVAQEQAERASNVPAVELPPAAANAAPSATSHDLPGDGSNDKQPSREPSTTTTTTTDGTSNADPAHPSTSSHDTPTQHSRPENIPLPERPSPATMASYLLHPGRDGGGSSSGTNTPHERNESDILASTNPADATFTPPPATNAGTAARDTEYFRRPTGETGGVRPAALQNALAQKHDSSEGRTRTVPQRKPTLPEDIERWVRESGMGRGRHADALGDEPEDVYARRDASDGSGPGSRRGEEEGAGRIIPEEEEERELEDEGEAQVMPGRVRQEVLEAEEALRREEAEREEAEESVRVREERRAERVRREIEEEQEDMERRERGVRESVY